MSHVTDLTDERSGERAVAIHAVQRARPLRLLLLHNGDRRLAALDTVLCELGYEAMALASPDDARELIERDGPPDVLLTTCDAGGAMLGLAFARECLARYPALRAIYVAWLPWAVPPRLVQRERVLDAPFTAAHLAAAVAARMPAINMAIINGS